MGSDWIPVEQSVTVSGIVYGLIEFVVHDWSGAVEFTNYGALTTICHLLIYLILLKIGLKVSTGVRLIPVKSFLNQTTHSKVIIEHPMLHICLSLDEAH